jgi:hypothetical protein
LQSTGVSLNDEPLVLGSDDTLPEITPVKVDGSRITLAPTSVNFVVFADTGNPECAK